MSITITFQNDLANRLQSEATQRKVTVEELATSILDQAIGPKTDVWGEQNQRRLVLIRKSIRQTLSVEERQELDALQAALDAKYEDFDSALHTQLECIRSAIE